MNKQPTQQPPEFSTDPNSDYQILVEKYCDAMQVVNGAIAILRSVPSESSEFTKWHTALETHVQKAQQIFRQLHPRYESNPHSSAVTASSSN